MLSIFFITTSLLALSANALPYHNPYAAQTVATTEKWSIPALDMKMMTRYTGLPGNQPWPESMKFPSTIDFNINMPDNRNAHCHTEWANGTLPGDLAACTGEDVRVRFRMKDYADLGVRRRELSFVLQVFRLDRLPGQQTILMGETPITANDPYEPSSYLTCMLGAPFDGLRCKINGMMSNHKMLVLEAHTSNDTNTSELLPTSHDNQS